VLIAQSIDEGQTVAGELSFRVAAKNQREQATS
jgi:hypothetical protein